MLRARDNPFAVERVLRLRYRFRNDDWPALLNRLQTLNYRAAIVGPKGSGKTTLLEDLAARLETSGLRIHRLFLNEQCRDPASFVRCVRDSLSNRDVILFDGCEQLSLPAWWRFRWETRRAGGLVITTHRPGRLPTLIKCQTTRELFRELVRSLHDPAASAPEMLDRLFEKHQGNLRDAIRGLYDLAAREPKSGPAQSRLVLERELKFDVLFGQRLPTDFDVRVDEEVQRLARGLWDQRDVSAD